MIRSAGAKDRLIGGDLEAAERLADPVRAAGRDVLRGAAHEAREEGRALDLLRRELRELRRSL